MTRDEQLTALVERWRSDIWTGSFKEAADALAAILAEGDTEAERLVLRLRELAASAATDPVCSAYGHAAELLAGALLNASPAPVNASPPPLDPAVVAELERLMQAWQAEANPNPVNSLVRTFNAAGDFCRFALQHWPAILAALRQAAGPVRPPYDCCPVCGGDCGSANPPVLHCPMRPERAPPTVTPPDLARLRLLCAEVYQVVGALAERYPDCGAAIARVLDNLLAAAEGRPCPHDELLPFVVPGLTVTDAMLNAALRFPQTEDVLFLSDKWWRAAIEAALQAQRGE